MNNLVVKEMDIERINKGVIVSLVLLILLVSASPLFAGEPVGELSLEEALAFGLENNSGLKAAYEQLQRQERDLMEAIQLKWQVDMELDTNYRWNLDQASELDIREDGKGNYSINISAGKSFLSGLYLSPGININENERTGDVETSYSIAVRKSLYPLVPAELARSFYKSELELLKARRNFAGNRLNAVLSWLDAYLNLVRLESRLAIYQENLLKAEANLEKVLARAEIGDAGENDILAARLGLENACYSLQEAENNLDNLRFNFLNELGLAPDQELTIRDKNGYLAQLWGRVENQVQKFLTMDRGALLEMVEKNNARLAANLLDREILEKELEWLEKEGGPEVGMYSSYDSAQDNLRVGLSLSYSLYDGGHHKRSIENKEKELRDNRQNYEEIYRQLKQELKRQLDGLELSRMAMRRAELSLARSENELKLAEKQLEMGVIDYLAYQDKWTGAIEARIALKSLEDELFLNSLDFLNFLDQDLLSELLGGIER